MLDQLGPAVNAAHSLFIYGPPGNGKTVIAQSIRNLLDGEGPAPQPLVAYVLACDARLSLLSLDDMFRGAVLFEDLP